jgi:hypothetical protein
VKWLAFSAAQPRDRSAFAKSVRDMRFETRSMLPIGAACVVANGVRETLSSLLGASVGMRLFEPSIPSAQAWSAIFERARLYRLRGSVADAAIVLRPIDAAALAAALFGESRPPGARDLSPIECDVIDRLISTIAINFAAVCGSGEATGAEYVHAVAGFVTYFELIVEGPVNAQIGIALSRDPMPESGRQLDAARLARVRLTTTAALDLGSAQAVAVARVAIGAMLPIPPAAFHRCRLIAHRQLLAEGSCGVANGQYAFSVNASHGGSSF